MQINPMSAIPAAGLAAATLLPGFTPKRRALGALLVGGTQAAKTIVDPDGLKLLSLVPEADDQLPDEQAQYVSAAATGLLTGLAAVPLVGIARIFPIGRLTAAAALAGGYVVLDAKLTEMAKSASTRAAVARKHAEAAKQAAAEAKSSAEAEQKKADEIEKARAAGQSERRDTASSASDAAGSASDAAAQAAQSAPSQPTGDATGSTGQAPGQV